ncbi:MAG: hypothetical protein A2161_22455 [Candidatus Schekmanbacteria bacterium RBG_13_48_7]|uniref:Radical SAM core domain-containing protein n=1 Tax=Candidatus Schekmanbacteria bacterium RBG_13_48_7 TaxID=1817878 RepID=A0A1F7RIB0_9BACT|nr:MAG: hypothetical protein A2161_22455 [Candidatus Schekmanbacteria bacterium RBG_13_48_7]
MGKNIHWRVIPLIKKPRKSLQFLYHRMKSEIAYRYPFEFAPAPFELIFFLTYKCNLSCSFCGQRKKDVGYISKLPKGMTDSEVSVDVLKILLDELSPEKTELTLCGGEIFFYRDWKKFLDYAFKKGFRITIITNGTHLPENAEYFVDNRLNRLTVSIDGPERVHDRLRGKPGLYSDILKGLEKIISLRKTINTGYPLIWINCTVSNLNQGHLLEFYNSVKSITFDKICFQHIFHLNKKTLETHDSIFKSLFEMECYDWRGYLDNLEGLSVDLLHKELAELKSINDPRILVIPDFTEYEIHEYYKNPDFRSTTYQWKCKGPWRSVYVLPDGTVTPCCFYKAGNIRYNSFKEIWNGKPIRKFRNQLRKLSVFPVCYTCPVLYRY